MYRLQFRDGSVLGCYQSYAKAADASLAYEAAHEIQVYIPSMGVWVKVP